MHEALHWLLISNSTYKGVCLVQPTIELRFSVVTNNLLCLRGEGYFVRIIVKSCKHSKGLLLHASEMSGRHGKGLDQGFLASF